MDFIERENEIIDKLRMYNQFSSKFDEYVIGRATSSRLRQHPAYEEYLNDPQSVPSKLRRIFDAAWKSQKDDEAFRLFRDSEIS